MPDNKHLQWFDIDDFTQGLWNSTGTKNKFAAPSNAFVTMDDYQPMKGGGVRPFYAASAISMSGIGANEVPTGIFARNGVSRPTGVGGTGFDSVDMVLVTMNTSDFKWRIYRRDGTVASPAWSLQFTSAAASNAGHQVTGFEYFKDINGVEWYLISIFGGTPTGLYTMRLDFTVASNTGNDGLVAKIQTFGGPICVSQARILIGTGNDSKIQYSAVGLTTGFGSFLDVAPNRIESNVSIISGIEPADLLIGKEGSPWVNIAGDISSTSTPVREMGDLHHQRQDKQQVPRTPGGIAFIEGTGRVFETDGRNFKSLGDQIAARPMTVNPFMVGAGTMAILDELLFVPGLDGAVTGLVYDFTTGAWFTTTGINPVFSWADPYGGNIWSTNHSASSPAVVNYGLLNSGSRVSTGVLQTVPFADKNGRNLDIREVQLFVQNAVSSDYSVSLVDQTGTVIVTRTASQVTDRQMVKFMFPQTKSEYLSVRITPSAHDGVSEAPTIERIRIGFGINNLIA